MHGPNPANAFDLFGYYNESTEGGRQKLDCAFKQFITGILVKIHFLLEHNIPKAGNTCSNLLFAQ